MLSDLQEYRSDERWSHPWTFIILGEYETTIIKTGGLTFKTIEGRYVGEGGTTIYIRKDGTWYNVDTVWCY